MLDAYNNGANDVANAWATSVSSRSVSYRWAMVLGTCFEMLGALTVGMFARRYTNLHTLIHHRCPNGRYDQERHHPSNCLPRQCWCSDAGLHMRPRRCLNMGYVVYQALCPRLLHILSHISRCRCWCCYRWCKPSSMGMERRQGSRGTLLYRVVRACLELH